MAEQPPHPLVLAPLDPTAITSAHVVCICASMKPAPGLATPSATRSLILSAAESVAMAYPALKVLDLRCTPLPLFDGRRPADMPRNPVGDCLAVVERAGGLFFGIPAYWNAIGACFKNFVEVLGGPAYDRGSAATPFQGKRVGYFVIGADDPSSRHAGLQAREIFASLGAIVVGVPVVFGNPAQSAGELPGLAQRILIELGNLTLEVGRANRSAR